MHIGGGVVPPLRGNGYRQAGVAIARRTEAVVNIVAKEERSRDLGVRARAVHQNDCGFTIGVSEDLERNHG